LSAFRRAFSVKLLEVAVVRALFFAALAAACTTPRQEAARAPLPLGECLDTPVGPPGRPPPTPLSSSPLEPRFRVAIAPDAARGGRVARLEGLDATFSVRSYAETWARGEHRPPDCCAEWSREFALVREATMPAARWLFGARAGEEELGVYVLAEPAASAASQIAAAGEAEVARINRDSARGAPRSPEVDTHLVKDVVGEWTRVRLAYERWYCDYGGVAYVDVYLRTAGEATVALFETYRGQVEHDRETRARGTWSEVHASFVVGGDPARAAGALPRWRQVVASGSNVAPERVERRLVEPRAKLVTGPWATWLEVAYDARWDWARVPGVDRVPLLVFGAEDAPVPKDETLDAAQIAAAARWAGDEARVARVHGANALAFRTEAEARAAFVRAFRLEPQGIVLLDDGEPALVRDELEQRGSPVEPCLTRRLGLITARPATTPHECPVAR
jgi:hypothetical protein